MEKGFRSSLGCGSAGKTHWMNRAAVLLAMILLAFLFTPPPVISGQTQTADSLMRITLERALEYLDITPAELGFDKAWAEDDTFRLALIERCLADPLSISGYADSLAERLDAGIEDVPEIVTYMSAVLDAPLHPWFPTHSEQEDAPVLQEKDAPETDTEGPWRRFETELEMVRGHLDQAFSGLTMAERDSILRLAPIAWGEFEDSLDVALKGALHFEFGHTVDTLGTVEDEILMNLAPKVDRSELGTAARLLVSSILSLIPEAEAWRSAPRSAVGVYMEIPGVEGQVIFYEECPWGDVVVGGTGRNVYDGRFAVIVDLGGDDVYRGRIAGAVGDFSHPVAALLDLDGDDCYLADSTLFSLGGGVLGLGALVDLAGNDTYRGFHYSLGAGFFGAGVLLDGGGSDIFEGGYFTQGAAHVGLGLLFSDGGNDSYVAQRSAQGFSSTFGFGLLVDKSGNDLYNASGRYLHRPLLPTDYQSFSQGFSIGYRPRASGGVGCLYDAEGNDFYNAEVYAQGTSYWYALGMLIDRAGNDKYNATQYCQGAGVHLSVGYLEDGDGDDHYVSKFGVTQGAAHDLSVGVLIDGAGRDSYTVSDGQGASLTNSVAIFVDVEGDDHYATRGAYSQGDVRKARGFGGAALFLDLEGKDTYARHSPGADSTVWRQHRWGVGIDLPRDTVKPEEKVPEIVLSEEDSLRDVAELFKTASLWEVSENREKVRRARKALTAKGMEALTYISENKLGTRQGLELRAIKEVAEAYPDSFAPVLLSIIEFPTEDALGLRTQGNAIYLLGETKRSEAVPSLTGILGSPTREKLHTRCIQALGKIGELGAAPAIRPFLTDFSERRRLATVVALSDLGDTTAVSSLVRRLEDRVFTVRSAAALALPKFGEEAGESLLDHLRDPRLRHRPLAIEVLGEVCSAWAAQDGIQPGERQRLITWLARDVLLKDLESQDPGLRRAAAQALLEFGGESTRAFVEFKLEDEFDAFVRGVAREQE